MMDHVEERKQDARVWVAVQEKVIHVLQKILTEDDICESVLHKLYGIIATNCVRVEDRICLYPVVAMINHSCVANSCYTFNGETNSVQLRAKRRLEAGEEITVCYTDTWCDTNCNHVNPNCPVGSVRAPAALTPRTLGFGHEI